MQSQICSETSQATGVVIFSAPYWEKFAMAADWRDDNQYAHFDELGISGLAWECLRRNTHYRKDYDMMQEGGGAPADWGLRFPGRPRAQRAWRSRLLAAFRRTRRGSPDSVSARHRRDRRHSYRQHHRAQNGRRRTVMDATGERCESCRQSGR
ncbi:transcriptional regulator domain-containing protein [Nitratireductor thuwali]|uniref:transcriptional regulator domain-containing protein n=1 Tax=Nitratireductor thuwali TaxID=2267699 RepID=UPI003BB2069B